MHLYSVPHSYLRAESWASRYSKPQLTFWLSSDWLGLAWFVLGRIGLARIVSAWLGFTRLGSPHLGSVRLGPGLIWTDAKKPSSHRDSIPDRPACRSVTIPIELPGPQFLTVHTAMVYIIQVCGHLASRILFPLASCQQTCMTYTIAVCTVTDSWW